MSGFTKLHSSILNSSIWDEQDSTRVVWITMLVMADAFGFVESSLPGLAHQARKSREETLAALAILSGPDSESKNPDHDGRRVRKVEGGWMILNYPVYRAQADLSDDPETVATRERVRRHRERKRAERMAVIEGGPFQKRFKTVTGVTSVSSASASASEDGEKEGGVQRGTGEGDGFQLEGIQPQRASKSRCTEEEAKRFCSSIGLPASDGTAMFLHWEEKGWAKVKDWKLTIRKWQSFGYLPSQKGNHNGKSNRRTEADRDRDRTGIESNEVGKNLKRL